MGNGRTAGSKAQPLARPLFLSLTRTAQLLGVAPSTLCEMRQRHALFAPCLAGLPAKADKVRGRRVGAKLTRFHTRQVELIEAVLAGGMDVEEAWLRWQLERAEIGQGQGELTAASKALAHQR